MAWQVDAIDRYFRTGAEKDARAAAALGEPAVARALRELIRADRCRSCWTEGERAAALLALVPPRSEIVDVAWRMRWADSVGGNAGLNLSHIVAQAGPSVLRPLHDVILDRSQDLDALGAVETLAGMWPLYPELRPDILAAWGDALRVREECPELIGYLAYEAMELGVGELGLALLRLVESGAAEDEADAKEIRAWIARGCPASKGTRRKMPDFRFVFGGPSEPFEDDSVPLQRLLEEWQAADPACAVAPDAWLHHRLWYCAHNGALEPYTVEGFLLEYLPEQFVGSDEEQQRLPDDFDRFVDRLKPKGVGAIRRKIRESRAGFERLRHDPRVFSKSKRILLAAREAGVEPLDRAAALAWWYESRAGVGEAEWQLPAEYRLGDAYIAGRVQ